MISVTLSKIADVLGAEHRGADLTLDTVITDTRKVTPGCLFVALKGERFDAHDFADKAKANGAGALLVSRPLDIDLPQVIVKDTRQAFGQLAAWVRMQVPARVVALTGSSGKTSVKEMTAAILSQCGNTLYTAGNFNNDIGVPITLLRLNHDYDYAVIELGANHQGEIAWTVSLTRPEAALVNNLAAAHLEGFGSLAGVAKAKGEIYTGLPENGIAIMNADNNDWLNWQSIIGDRQVWRFSPNAANSDFTAANIHVTSHGTEFTLQTPMGSIDVLLPLPGRHNIANALAAAALSMAVGATLTAIKAGLAALKAVPGRLFPIQLSENQLVLDDAYNANVGSMTAAVQVLSEMPGYRVLVVGDMAELGAESEACHIQVGEAAKAAGIDRVLSTGKLSQAISHASGVGEHFADKAALIARLRSASGATNDDYFSERITQRRDGRCGSCVTGERFMLVWLAEHLVKYYSGFNVFSYLTFRAIVSLLTALFISLWMGPRMIARLQKLSFGQVVRNDGPESHFSKRGTPTMGGIMILTAIVISVLLWAYPSNPYVWCVLVVLIGYGIIGFVDDYHKVVRKDTKGLIARWKYFWMSVIALGVAFALYLVGKDTPATQLVVPFFKDVMPQLGLFYILLSYFVIVGTGNAVNLTDGLDGLAIMPTVFVAAGFALVAWATGNMNFANYLHIPYLRYAGELVIVCTAIVGAGLGFLWFNTYPAQVFMGDVGSLALGGALGIIAVLLRQEFLLVIMGGVFVVETLSVILQVGSFKLRGQRIFRMAPIHHHYELKGWPEPRVIVRFWIISLMLVLIGLATLKVR